MAGGDQQPEHDQKQPTWIYRAENGAAPETPEDPAAAVRQETSDSEVEWTASEFIAYQKNALWYLGLAGVTLVIDALIYWVTREIVPLIAITAMSIIMGVAAAGKPRLVTYRLERGGLLAGKRFYPYGNFKSFAIIDEGAFASILLLPAKRFALPVNVYFSPEDEEAITNALAKHLPLQPGSLTDMDRLMRYLRF
jgi:hypothetical protein